MVSKDDPYRGQEDLKRERAAQQAAVAALSPALAPVTSEREQSVSDWSLGAPPAPKARAPPKVVLARGQEEAVERETGALVIQKRQMPPDVVMRVAPQERAPLPRQSQAPSTPSPRSLVLPGHAPQPSPERQPDPAKRKTEAANTPATAVHNPCVASNNPVTAETPQLEMSSSNPRFSTTSNNRGWGYERREGFHGSGGQGGGEQLQGRGRGGSRGWGGRLDSYNTGRDPDGTRTGPGRDPDGTRGRSSTKSWERGVRREHHFLSRGGRGGGSGSVGGRELSREGRDHSPTLPHSSNWRAHPIAESAPAPVSPACTGTSSPSKPNAAAVSVENVVSGDTSTALGSVTPPAPRESGWGTPDAHRSRSPSPSQSHGSHGSKRSGWADGGDGLEDRESIRARDKRERDSVVLERKRMADRLGPTTFADVDRERGCEGRDNDAEGWGSSSVVDIIPNKVL